MSSYNINSSGEQKQTVDIEKLKLAMALPTEQRKRAIIKLAGEIYQNPDTWLQNPFNALISCMPNTTNQDDSRFILKALFEISDKSSPEALNRLLLEGSLPDSELFTAATTIIRQNPGIYQNEHAKNVLRIIKIYHLNIMPKPEALPSFAELLGEIGRERSVEALASFIKQGVAIEESINSLGKIGHHNPGVAIIALKEVMETKKSPVIWTKANAALNTIIKTISIDVKFMNNREFWKDFEQLLKKEGLWYFSRKKALNFAKKTTNKPNPQIKDTPITSTRPLVRQAVDSIILSKPSSVKRNKAILNAIWGLAKQY